MTHRGKIVIAAIGAGFALAAIPTALVTAPGGPGIVTAPITQTSTNPLLAPPPPIMLPAPMPQVPCMGFKAGGCTNGETDGDG